jgi:glycosyltransferase involved in cell wall biosynthesis
MKEIYVWGYLHQCGGAGPEVGHIIELLRSRDIDVTCVLKAGTDVLGADEPRRKYFDAIGVKTKEYAPGVLTDKVVWCWCEQDLFSYIYRNDEKPALIAYWPCMNFLSVEEKIAIGRIPNLRVLCQSRYQQNALNNELIPLGLSHNFIHCEPYFNLLSSWSKFRNYPKDRSRFDVLKIGRDDPDKYPDNLWEIVHRFASPKPKGIHLIGWGPNGEAKIGDYRKPDHAYHGKLSGSINGHVYDPAVIGDMMSACHATLMYYPVVENAPRVAFEAMASGSIVVGSNTGGMPEFIEDGRTGLLCKNDEQVVYRLSALAFDTQARELMAMNAHTALMAGIGDGESAFRRFSEHL